jgi:hypothetical protein
VVANGMSDRWHLDTATIFVVIYLGS